MNCFDFRPRRNPKQIRLQFGNQLLSSLYIPKQCNCSFPISAVLAFIPFSNLLSFFLNFFFSLGKQFSFSYELDWLCAQRYSFPVCYYFEINWILWFWKAGEKSRKLSHGPSFLLRSSRPVHGSDQGILWEIRRCASAWMPLLALDHGQACLRPPLPPNDAARRQMWNKDKGTVCVASLTLPN